MNVSDRLQAALSRLSTAGMVLLLCLAWSQAAAEPSKTQVIKLWEGQQHKNKVLDVKPRGGQRSTNELHTKKYLYPVGTCWDYDVVELQKCGCRLFQRSSVCCRTGSSSECEIRVGDSKMVDCATYGKPKYGLSGNNEPAECKQQRTKSDCWGRTKEFAFGPGARIGPCMGSPYFNCPQKNQTALQFWDGKCGPTPEDCGCTIVEACSKPEHVKCYREWAGNKEAVDCYTNPAYKNNYEQSKCYENLKK